MLGKKKDDQKRFEVVSQESIPDLGKMTVLIDKETGVHYLHTWVGSGTGLTPLLDANGQVVVSGRPAPGGRY